MLDHREARDEVDGRVVERERVVGGSLVKRDVRRDDRGRDAEIESDAGANSRREPHEQVAVVTAAQVDDDPVRGHVTFHLPPPERRQDAVQPSLAVLPERRFPRRLFPLGHCRNLECADVLFRQNRRAADALLVALVVAAAVTVLVRAPAAFRSALHAAARETSARSGSEGVDARDADWSKWRRVGCGRACHSRAEPPTT